MMITAIWWMLVKQQLVANKLQTILIDRAMFLLLFVLLLVVVVVLVVVLVVAVVVVGPALLVKLWLPPAKESHLLTSAQLQNQAAAAELDSIMRVLSVPVVSYTKAASTVGAMGPRPSVTGGGIPGLPRSPGQNPSLG
eukprot:Skav235766  [mRNA]  locus=scaffold803:606638:607689:+ [translate_table: standard]